MRQAEATMKGAVPGIVIIPARNEAKTVGVVVRSVREYLGWEVIVVDDFSDDATVKEARENGARVLSLPFHTGAWGAVQTGMRYALRMGYQMALTMDADGQHTAESLSDVGAPVQQGLSEVAIGICPERVSGARLLAWMLFKRITGLNLQDLTSGLRVYNRDAMQVLTSSESAMLNYQDIGVLLLLRAAGLRVTEVKVEMEARTSGHSRVYDSWWTVTIYLAETLILSAGKWRPGWYRRDGFTIPNKHGRGR